MSLSPEEDHAAAAVEVDVVHVAAARGGNDVAHGREDGVVGRDLGGEADALAADRTRVALELSRELRLGHLAAQHLDVFQGHADAPALADPVPGQGGPRGEGDHDVLAETVLALHHVLLQAFPEGHEKGHRHRAPGDAEQGEGRAQLLVADVLKERPEEGQGVHATAYSIFLGGRSTTRSFSARPSATSTLRPSDSPVLISFTDGRGVAYARHLHRRLAVLEGDEPLRKEEHVGLLPDHDVGVGGVPGPQDGARGGQQLDLDVEEGGALLGLRFGGDLVDLALHLGLGECPDLDPRRHALVQLAYVDLVDRALEDELAHVGEGRERRARLVGGQGHHRVAFVDRELEHHARGGSPDDRLDREVLALHAALLGEGELVAGQLQADLRVLDVLVGEVGLLGRHDPLGTQGHRPVGLPPGLLVDVLRDLDLTARLGELERCRVGQDFEQGIAGGHPVAHLAEAALHDARDLALHRDLVLRSDRTHREGLLHDRAPRHRHRLEAAVLAGDGLAVERRRDASHEHYGPCSDQSFSHDGRHPFPSPRWWVAC